MTRFETDVKVASQFSPKCTHLITKTLRATEKVYLALINNIPIVDLEWLQALEQEASSNTLSFFEPPDPFE
jgi:phosphoribulokinase